ncbi:MAG: ATP-grasp domain-containing protein [Oligoflexia bacterium]|nr:ATP-grasp domain-containing protein [Oligoflexia bacterium]
MRVAIVNRGEVAVRIIRACQELGYASILIHSTPDKHTTAYRIADETYELEGQAAADTYLRIDSVVNACKNVRADLVHPGFGFLSENAAFAQALEEAGLTFIGPSAHSIALAGNKIKAKELAHKAGVPTVPSITNLDSDPQKQLEQARSIGFPCIIKAAAGGGGKGMKVVRKDSEFFEQLESASREAKAAFGSSTVFIEKFLETPRHIEVQIFGDKKGNLLHFFERECTIQRRHQKIFEETPSPSVNDSLRKSICEAALSLATAAHYYNAGTVEFLLDGDRFYFMELNTRLQVEHTVTELVCGVDLVKLQIEVAQGHELPFGQADIIQRGHALEVRVYAEDSARGFLPSIGKLTEVKLPLGPQRRFDFGFESGDEITPFYDPMIGKVITWATSRRDNLARMYATLCDTVVFGIHTNIEFLKDVLINEKFERNQVSTRFLDQEYQNGFTPLPPTPEQETEIKKALSSSQGPEAQFETKSSAHEALVRSPWSEVWRA